MGNRENQPGGYDDADHGRQRRGLDRDDYGRDRAGEDRQFADQQGRGRPGQYFQAYRDHRRDEEAGYGDYGRRQTEVRQGGPPSGQNEDYTPARRSQWREDQRLSDHRATGETYGHGADGGVDHDHEPHYRRWRDEQLASHDRDYARWRDLQARRYDEDYRGWRDQRHQAFSQEFHAWRQGQGAAEGQDAATGANSPTGAFGGPDGLTGAATGARGAQVGQGGPITGTSDSGGGATGSAQISGGAGGVAGAVSDAAGMGGVAQAFEGDYTNRSARTAPHTSAGSADSALGRTAPDPVQSVSDGGFGSEHDEDKKH